MAKSLIECMNPKCKRKFFAKLIKKYTVTRAGETKDQVSVEKLPDGKEKQHIRKVPADPFLVTTKFQQVAPYQNNPKYEVKKSLRPDTVFCQRCRNLISQREERMRIQEVRRKKFERAKELKAPTEVKIIDEEEARDFDRQLGRALSEGRVRIPQKK
jgi:hypothetical protein